MNTRYALTVFYVFFNLFALAQQNKATIVVNGKDYHISGDNLTIIIGNDPMVKVSNEVPQKVKQGIARKYEDNIARIKHRQQEGLVSLRAVEDSLKIYKRDFETANTQAEKLAGEFSRTDLTKQTYLYRLAYVVYTEGSVEDALEILNDKALDQIEQQQAMKYLLSASAYAAKNETEQTILKYETAAAKYPSYLTLSTYGDYLLHCGNFGQAKTTFFRAGKYADTPQKKFFLWGNLANIYYKTNHKDSAAYWCNKAIEQTDTAATVQSQLLACLYHIKGQLYLPAQKEFALDWFRKSIRMSEPADTSIATCELQAENHFQTGALYAGDGNPGKALEYLLPAHEQYESLNRARPGISNQRLLQIEILLSDVYIEKNDPQKGLEYILSAETFIKRSDIEDYKGTHLLYVQMLTRKAAIYDILGDRKQAKNAKKQLNHVKKNSTY